ncbi:MAG: heavy-metal-associated domain-containing protein [Vicinamibacteria bacterium]
MPKLSHLIACIALLFGVVAPLASCTEERSAAKKDPNMKTVVIPVEGMSCASCASKVKRALKDIPGVGDAVVDLGERRATVDYDPRQVGLDRLVAAINGTGFKAGAPAEAPR